MKVLDLIERGKWYDMIELLMDSESTELVEDFIEDFKNYMQDE